MSPWLRSGAWLLALGALGAVALRASSRAAPRVLGGPALVAAGALFALEAVFLAALSPAALLVFVGLLGGVAAIDRLVIARPLPARAPRPIRSIYTRWTAIALGLALGAAFVALRPPVPLYWDELVWLGKARLAAGTLDALRDATLDAHAVVPPGYPLYWPTAVGWLSFHHADAASLVVAARLLVGATVVLYVGAVGARARRPGRAWAVVAAAMVSAPFVFVHLRSVYVDLPVGLVTAALAAVLLAPARRSAAGVAFVLAGILASIKDEGLVHVLAIAGVTLVAASRARDPWRLRVRAPLAACVGAAVPFLVWRVLLVEHGAADEDHGLGWPDLATALPLARVWAAHAFDVRSWGLFWPLAAGVALSEWMRRDARGAAARSLAAMLAADAFAIFAGVMACPERVHEFARGGTLVGRLLVQHAPLATMLVAEVVETRFASVRRRLRPASAPIAGSAS